MGAVHIGRERPACRGHALGTGAQASKAVRAGSPTLACAFAELRFEGGPLNIVITGGAGFIGSALIRRLVQEGESGIVNVDKLTYAGNLDSLREVAGSSSYRFEHVDICDANALRRVFEQYRPAGVIHLAAESHVDRSIEAPRAFIDTNIVGTFTLLSEAHRHWAALDSDAAKRFRFLHISTDEVFGSLGPDGEFSERSAYAPSSPYSASKAASDHLARAWYHTYGLPVIVMTGSNNFGPYQYPEKLIPLVILNALEGRRLPVYDRGINVRDWLYVDDFTAAIMAAYRRGDTGRSYLVGGGSQRRNIDVVRAICALLDEARPGSPSFRHENLITFVPDRPGHDLRYAIDSSSIRQELDWHPDETFETGLRKTVHWYLDNHWWWGRMRAGGDGTRVHNRT